MEKIWTLTKEILDAPENLHRGMIKGLSWVSLQAYCMQIIKKI